MKQSARPTASVDALRVCRLQEWGDVSDRREQGAPMPTEIRRNRPGYLVDEIALRQFRTCAGAHEANVHAAIQLRPREGLAEA